jgi:hypothetical protein
MRMQTRGLNPVNELLQQELEEPLAALSLHLA